MLTGNLNTEKIIKLYQKEDFITMKCRVVSNKMIEFQTLQRLLLKTRFSNNHHTRISFKIFVDK